MQEIEQHQRRLATALLRIGSAFERLAEPPPASAVLARAQEAEDAAAEVEIARLNRLLAENQDQIAGLSEQLAVSQVRLEDAVLGLSAELEERDAQLAELRARPAVGADAPADLVPAAGVQALEAQLQASEAQVADLTARLASLSEQHSGSTATLEQVILALTAQLEAREAELAALRAAEPQVASSDLTGLQAEVALLTALQAETSQALAQALQRAEAAEAAEAAPSAGADADAAAREAEIAELSADVARLSALHSALQAELIAAREEIATLRQQLDLQADTTAALAAAQADNMALQQMLAESEAQIATLTDPQQHDAAQAQLDALQQQLSEREAEIAQLSARLEHLLTLQVETTTALTAAQDDTAALHEQLAARETQIAELSDPLQRDADRQDIARLQQLLADAQAHEAELTERLRILDQRHAETTLTLEGRLQALNAQVDSQGDEMVRMRGVNIQLREALRALREGLATGGIDAAQINRTMAAELEALNSARQFELSELEALIAALDPLIVTASADPVAEGAHA